MNEALQGRLLAPSFITGAAISVVANLSDDRPFSNHQEPPMMSVRPTFMASKPSLPYWKLITSSFSDTAYKLVADHNLPIGSGSLDFHLGFGHVDEQITNYLFRGTVIDEQAVLDARVGWSSNDDQWQVTLWGKNLTNEAYFSHS